MKSIIPLFLVILIIGCEKDNLNSINDLDVHIVLLDVNNHSSRAFNFGEDMVFKYTESNKTSETIYYFGTHCPSFHFQVYDDNDNLVGDAIPPNWGCTAVRLLLNIGPKETKVTEINWFNDSTNAPLPVGDYRLTFFNTIEIPKINDSKKYNLSIDFRVE